MPGFELMGNEELEEIKDIFAKGGVLFRFGFDNLRNGVFKVRDFEEAFAVRMGSKYGLGVTSGSTALRVALGALGVGKGDEVITQSFTFVATVESIIEAGAQPVIVEIDNTLNMDPRDLEKKISPRTKAIIVVHMLGTPCRMDEIMRIANSEGIPVIEDTAWGCGGKYRGRYLGTIGKIGTYSFDYAKILTTGEGGMLVTDDPEVYARAAAFHDHGHENNPKVQRWEDTRSGSGFNYRMNELQGAVGLAQLKKLDKIINGQRQSRQSMVEAIQDLPGLELRSVPPGSEETADALIYLVESKIVARRVRESLLEEGVGTKILPEAITWHFAGTWYHMPSLVNFYGGSLSGAFPQSSALLSRAIAVPVMVNMAPDVPGKVRQALEAVL